MLKPKFKVEFLEEAEHFLSQLDYKTKEKIIYNIRKAQVLRDDELFKKLNEEIWEFRTLFNKTKYRIFAFWDKSDKQDTLVITTHGRIKKTDKTLVADIAKAEQLRKQYMEQKKQQK